MFSQFPVSGPEGPTPQRDETEKGAGKAEEMFLVYPVYPVDPV